MRSNFAIRMQLIIHSAFKVPAYKTEIILILSFIFFTGVAFPTGLSAKSKCDRWYDGSYSDTIFWGLSSKEEIARCIKKVGINHRDYVGHTPLHSAVFHPNPKLENIKYFLKQGANINTYGRMLGMKYTPLMTAVGRRSPQSEIVLLLIDHGADLNAKDEKGKTAKQRYEGNNSQVIAALNGQRSKKSNNSTIPKSKNTVGSQPFKATCQADDLSCQDNRYICNYATNLSGLNYQIDYLFNTTGFVAEAKKRGITCGVGIGKRSRTFDFWFFSLTRSKQLAILVTLVFIFYILIPYVKDLITPQSGASNAEAIRATAHKQRRSQSPNLSYTLGKKIAYRVKGVVKKSGTFLLYGTICVALIFIGSSLNLFNASTPSKPKITSTQQIQQVTKTEQPVNRYLSEEIYKQKFINLSFEERRRTQYWLKLNYDYRSGIDGLWGKKTYLTIKAATENMSYRDNIPAKRALNQVVQAALSSVKTAPQIQKRASPQQTRPTQQANPRMAWCIAAGQSPRVSQNFNACLRSNGHTPYRAPQSNFAPPSYTTTFLKDWYRSRGNTMCRYHDGSVDNIGVGICPPSK